MKTKLELGCDRLDITAKFIPGATTRSADWAAHDWRVTLSRPGHDDLKVDFFGGSAVTAPTAGDVVSSLLLDTRVHEGNEYSDLGIEGSEAVKISRIMDDLVPAIREFFGEDFDKLAELEH